MKKISQLIISIICLCVGSLSAQAAQPGGAGILLGDWVNIDSMTGGLVEVSFSEMGGMTSIQAYGACSPTPCDWGMTDVTFYSNSVTDPQAQWGSAFYDQGFKTANLIIQYNSTSDTVVVYVFNVMNDDRYNYFAKEVFRRARVDQ